ncbi:nuclear transport factor 2 family protein [Parvularcula lutaonensis]|uniref:Nuclear transport factor 2 family protein n=1 Tax=Parvularcula lutaonensis TaxID=491923 RepID=A0ABV7MEM3_9PROT|nr:nuclear transport factor 2 family protein [Parvularcula lutaonensis]GGY51943.1 hypothetical protein GCM10007148_21120 [Parvularcula lutaonensis]
MLELLVAAAAAQGFDCSTDHPAAAARATFNRAIREKKTGVIKRLLDEDVVLVTGTDSGVISGRDAQLAIWREDFKNPNRIVFQRTPLCIAASKVEPIATEIGRWVGRPERPDGSEVGGDYTAKWRKVDGRWLLEAEIFTTMHEREALAIP